MINFAQNYDLYMGLFNRYTADTGDLKFALWEGNEKYCNPKNWFTILPLEYYQSGAQVKCYNYAVSCPYFCKISIYIKDQSMGAKTASNYFLRDFIKMSYFDITH